MKQDIPSTQTHALFARGLIRSKNETNLFKMDNILNSLSYTILKSFIKHDIKLNICELNSLDTMNKPSKIQNFPENWQTPFETNMNMMSLCNLFRYI